MAWHGKLDHNRYYHSVGVMKVASYLYDEIDKEKKISNPFERQFLRLAALMHDVGHLPFSHLIESVFNELNWKPADYKEYYSHEFQTEKRIDKIFSDPEYKNTLPSLGYSINDLKKLINGCFGVGYLDAIIDSQVDSDKIDYVFRDTGCTQRKIFLDPIQFLRDITNGLTITPEKYLSFSRVAAVAAAQLIEARQHLYRHLYLQPGIVILEGIVKLIIKTFFVHSIEFDSNDYLDSGEYEIDYRDIIKEMHFDSNDYPDFGEYKINYCISKLKKIMANVARDHSYEKKITKKMFKSVEEREPYLNEIFMQNLRSSYKLICDTRSNRDINILENKIVHRRTKFQRDKISEIMRDISFRFPGAAIMEAV